MDYSTFLIQNKETGLYLDSLRELRHPTQSHTRFYTIEYTERSDRPRRLSTDEVESILMQIYSIYCHRLKIETQIEQTRDKKFRALRRQVDKELNRLHTVISDFEKCTILTYSVSDDPDGERIGPRGYLVKGEQLNGQEIISRIITDILDGDFESALFEEFEIDVNTSSSKFKKVFKEKKVYALLSIEDGWEGDQYERIERLGIKFYESEDDLFEFYNEEDVNFLRLAEMQLVQENKLVLVQDMERVYNNIKAKMNSFKFFEGLI